WRGTSYSFAAQPLAGRRDRHSCPHDALPIFSGAQNGRRRPLSPVPPVHRRRLARRAMGHSPRSPPEVPLTCPFPPCRRLPLGNPPSVCCIHCRPCCFGASSVVFPSVQGGPFSVG